jgi:tetratricopeptide (TPR) repeat protein
MNLGLLLAMQNRYREATSHFTSSLEIVQSLGEEYQTHLAYIQGFWGVLLIRQGKLEKAEENLKRSLIIRGERHVSIDIPEVLVWLGRLHETREEWKAALDWYSRPELKSTGRCYFESQALEGLCRAKCQSGEFTDILPYVAEAEEMAQRYEYNDHLASLRLTQGHIAWEGCIPEWKSGFNAALHYYQQALMYALRYNRFLLDEILWGGGIATPLRPIIPYCLERDEEGRRMLVELCDWWQTGTNDVGAPRPGTISPIPEGIPLLEAERIARKREPGDGSVQVTVVEKVEQALN